MNERSFEKAFAPVPQVVLDHIDEALEAVQAMNRKRRKPTYALVFAIVLALAMAGGAVAAGINWNALDFLSRGLETGAALPEVRDLVQTNIPQSGGAMDEAIYTMEEAMCDGYDAYVVFSVKPTHEDTLLVYGQSTSSAPASRFFPELPSDISIAEWAEKKGYTRIEAIRLTHNNITLDDGFVWSESSVHCEEDGTFRFMLKGRYHATEPQEITFSCHTVTRWTKDGSKTVRAVTELTATLEPAPAPLWTREWEGEAEIPGTGIVIEKIVLTGTPIAMHAEITHSGDGSRYLVMMYLLDDDGNHRKWSAGTGIGWETTHHQSLGERYDVDADFNYYSDPDRIFIRLIDYYDYEATADPPTRLTITIDQPGPSPYKQEEPLVIKLE